MPDRPSTAGSGAAGHASAEQAATDRRRGGRLPASPHGADGDGARHLAELGHGRQRLTGTGHGRRRLADLGDEGSLDPRRPLPAFLQPLARVLAPGRAVTYTTGGRTRAALDTAGAVAAASGTVLHLPRPPGAGPGDLGIVAHELSHVGQHRTRPHRPELWSPGATALDDGERRARRVGGAVTAAARSAAAVPSGTGELPVRGAGARDQVLSAARAAATEAVTAPPVPVPALAPPAGPPSRPAETAPRPTATSGDGVAADGPDAPLIATGSAAQDPESRLGELLEALEERVLLEIERRGGRWGGTF